MLMQDRLVDRLLGPDEPVEPFAALSAADVAGLVGRLKGEADRHWLIDPRRSLAELSVRIGACRGEQAHTALGRPHHARRRFEAAVATVERAQRSLPITLRPGFLEDKGEAITR